MHPEAKFLHSEEVNDEEIDVISYDPLIIAECTLIIRDVKKLKKAVRKKAAVEKLMQKPAIFYVMTTCINGTSLQELQDMAKDADIILVHGLVYSQ